MLTIYATEISEIYGHGRRLVIWFSGCTLRCKGCINSHLWDKDSGRETNADELWHAIQTAEKITGVTFIGGEPLEQGKELLDLSEYVIAAGLDIVLFTGYDPSEFNSLQQQIVHHAAVLISGRYDASKRDTYLAHRGSGNQIVTVKDENLRQHYVNECRQVEIEITDDGEKYLGFPEDFF